MSRFSGRVKEFKEVLGGFSSRIRCSKCGALFGCNCNKELLQSDIPTESPFQLSSKPERGNRFESFRDRVKETFERAIHGCQKCGSRFGCRCSEAITADDIPEVSLLTDSRERENSERADPSHVLRGVIDEGQKNVERKPDQSLNANSQAHIQEESSLKLKISNLKTNDEKIQTAPLKQVEEPIQLSPSNQGLSPSKPIRPQIVEPIEPQPLIVPAKAVETPLLEVSSIKPTVSETKQVASEEYQRLEPVKEKPAVFDSKHLVSEVNHRLEPVKESVDPIKTLHRSTSELTKTAYEPRIEEKPEKKIEPSVDARKSELSVHKSDTAKTVIATEATKELFTKELATKGVPTTKGVPSPPTIQEGLRRVTKVGGQTSKGRSQGSLVPRVTKRAVVKQERSRVNSPQIEAPRIVTKALGVFRKIHLEPNQRTKNTTDASRRQEVERINLLLRNQKTSSNLERRQVLSRRPQTAILVNKNIMQRRALPHIHRRILSVPLNRTLVRVIWKRELRRELRDVKTKIDLLRSNLMSRRLNTAIAKLKPELRTTIRKIFEKSPLRLRVTILKTLREERRNLSRQLREPIQTEGKRVRQVLRRIANTIEPEIRKFIAFYIVNQLGFYRNARDLIRLAREVNKEWAKKLKKLDLEKILASGAEVLMDEKIKKKVKKKGEKKYSRVNHSAEKLSSSFKRAVTLTADGAVPKLELDIVTTKEENNDPMWLD